MWWVVSTLRVCDVNSCKEYYRPEQQTNETSSLQKWQVNNWTFEVCDVEDGNLTHLTTLILLQSSFTPQSKKRLIYLLGFVYINDMCSAHSNINDFNVLNEMSELVNKIERYHVWKITETNSWEAYVSMVRDNDHTDGMLYDVYKMVRCDLPQLFLHISTNDALSHVELCTFTPPDCCMTAAWSDGMMKIGTKS